MEPMSRSRSFIAVLAILVGFVAMAVVLIARRPEPARQTTSSRIPFGLIGVVLGHLVPCLAISATLFMSFFGLSGVVVNDSLVVIDFIGQRLRVAPIQRRRSLMAPRNASGTSC